jgi:hypothetical protein
LFVTVIDFVFVVPTRVFPKATDVAESEIVGAGATPVPESGSRLGDPATLEAIDSDALRVPPAVGRNDTETAQVAPGAIVLLVQVFVPIT